MMVSVCRYCVQLVESVLRFTTSVLMTEAKIQFFRLNVNICFIIININLLAHVKIPQDASHE